MVATSNEKSQVITSLSYLSHALQNLFYKWFYCFCFLDTCYTICLSVLVIFCHMSLVFNETGQKKTRTNMQK